MMKEQMKTVFNSMRIAALAGAMATVGAGCVTTDSQNGQAKASPYFDYIDPRTEGFQAIKEAYEKDGKKVEATFVQDAQGNRVVTYGVRDKTFRERTIDHLNDNEGIYKNIHRAVDSTTKIGGLTTDIINAHTLKGIRR